MRKYIALLAVLFSSPVFAAPTVTSYSGTMGHGDNIVISGTDFGTKSTAAPQKWDNFESGTLGVDIPGQNAVVGGAWSGYTSSTTYPAYSNVQLRNNSARSSRHAFDASNYNVSLDVNETNSEYYFSFWYYTTQPDAARQSKPWVIYGSSAAGPELYIGWGQVGVDSDLRSNCIDESGSLSAVYDGVLENHRNKWIRMEVYAKQSSSGSANDGIYRIWIDGSLAIEKSPAVTRTTSNYWRQVELGSYNGGGGGSWSAYMDDVYVDSTQARIEICSGSAWASKGTCEIQIPSAWSATEITAVVNRASFGASDNAYLYVVDSTGAANSSGYAITFGDQGAADTTPAAFTFTDNSSVALSTVIYSTFIQVTAIDNDTSIAISGTGCEYRVNGAGSWLTSGDNVVLNDNVAMRVTSSGSYSTDTPCVLTLNGNVSDTWHVTTLAAVSDPVAPRMRAGSMAGGWR